MAETKISEYEINLDGISFAFDHDGNVHPNDIGQDYLLELLPYDSPEEFEDKVKEMRGDEKLNYSQYYLNGEEYSESEELGIMISQNMIPKEEIKYRASGDGFREGFPEFLKDISESGRPTFIISAGDKDFLEEFYRNSETIDTEITHIAGTKQLWKPDREGVERPVGIINGCGRDKKALRYREAVEFNGIPHATVIASGDSHGDSSLMDYARKTGGIGISTSQNAEEHGNIVVEGNGWNGQAAASLIFSGLFNGQEESLIRGEVLNYLENNPGDCRGISIRPGGQDELSYVSEEYGDLKPGEKISEIWEDIKDE